MRWSRTLVLGVAICLIGGIAWAQKAEKKPPKQVGPEIPVLAQWLAMIDRTTGARHGDSRARAVA